MKRSRFSEEVPVRCTSPVERELGLLRCYGSVTPGEEFVEACDLVVGDLGQDPCEPGLRIDVVALGGFDESEGDCHSFAVSTQRNLLRLSC